MTQFEVKPTIQICDTCAELAQALELGPKDLILTNQYIYDPYFGPLNLSCPTIFQEKYGAGEPSDEMVTAIYNDMPKDVTRIVAVGGGTVVDIAKVLSLKTVTPILDLYDGKIPLEKGKELILVPTTCGTGSEVTNLSILALISLNTKKGLGAPCMFGDKAVLVPRAAEDPAPVRLRHQFHRCPHPLHRVQPLPQSQPHHRALWVQGH